jgi:uncharacterized protein YcfL
MKNLLSLLAVSTLLLGGAGCQSGGAYLPKNATKYNYEDSSNLVLMDSMVQRSVTSPGLQETTLPDGRLQVVANVRNRETRRIQVQVQCVFKDAQGFEVDSTPWNTLILTENAQESVKFISMNNQARRYTVRVRQAH